MLLITATAPRLGLVERAARANSMHANLFISIHHDRKRMRVAPWHGLRGARPKHNG
jgi:N-acetylmuramoyl-L-alanine amidase